MRYQPFDSKRSACRFTLTALPLRSLSFRKKIKFKKFLILRNFPDTSIPNIPSFQFEILPSPTIRKVGLEDQTVRVSLSFGLSGKRLKIAFGYSNGRERLFLEDPGKINYQIRNSLILFFSKKSSIPEMTCLSNLLDFNEEQSTDRISRLLLYILDMIFMDQDRNVFWLSVEFNFGVVH